MINFIVMPMFITRANTTRIVISHGSCTFTSTAKESGVQEETAKNCFIHAIGEPWGETNMPRFFEIITISWSSYIRLMFVPMLIIISHLMIILSLGIIIIVLVCGMLLKHVTFLTHRFSSLILSFHTLRRDVKQSRWFWSHL